MSEKMSDSEFIGTVLDSGVFNSRLPLIVGTLAIGMALGAFGLWYLQGVFAEPPPEYKPTLG